MSEAKTDDKAPIPTLGGKVVFVMSIHIEDGVLQGQIVTAQTSALKAIEVALYAQTLLGRHADQLHDVVGDALEAAQER